MAVDPIGTLPKVNPPNERIDPADRKFLEINGVLPEAGADKAAEDADEPAPAADAKEGVEHLSETAGKFLLEEDLERLAGDPKQAPNDEPGQKSESESKSESASGRPERHHERGERRARRKRDGEAFSPEKHRVEQARRQHRREKLAEELGVKVDEVADRGGTNTVKVRRGESLTKIAARFGLSVDELLKHNDISDPDRIDVGDRLEIPAWAEAPEVDTKVDEAADRERSSAQTLMLNAARFGEEALHEAAAEAREQAEGMEMADKVIEDLMARGMVELAEKFESEIAEGKVRFVSKDELGLDGASAVYDASSGQVLIPSEDLEEAVEASDLFGTTDNRFMAMFVDGLAHELGHDDHHEHGTHEEDSVVQEAARKAAEDRERFGAMPFAPDDAAAIEDGINKELVSVYNAEFEIEAYRAGEMARYEAGYDAPVGGWMTIDEDGKPLADDLAHGNIDEHVLGNPELVASLAENLIAGASVDPRWRRPDAENPRWRRPDVENPRWRRPDAENPRWRRPDVENPRWRRPDVENPRWRRPDVENPRWRRPDVENPRWRRPTTGNA